MIKDIVIVGGGFSGYMTGLLIKHAFCDDLWPEIAITIVESSSIGTVGVGESTAQNVPMLLAKVGIDPFKFMKESNGTFKMSARFDNWNYEGESFHHMLHSLSLILDLKLEKKKINLFDFFNPYTEIGVDILHYLANEDSGEYGFDNLCLENKVPFIKTNDYYEIQRIKAGNLRMDTMVGNDLSSALGMHMDANLSVDFLKKKCRARDIRVIDGKVTSWKQNKKTGNLTELKLDTGRKIKGDFFFDCTGFRRLILGDVFKEEFVDYSKWLPQNAVSLIDGGVKYKEGEDPNVYTILDAQKHGYMFKIPLRDRMGSGYVYSDRFIDKETIQKEQLEHWNNQGYDPSIGNQLSWTPGRYKRSWVKNCVAVGLSEGFLEPLDGSALILSLGLLTQVLFPMFNKNMAFEGLDVDYYNKQVNIAYEHTTDYICYCHLQKRKDSEYWKYFKEDNNIPDSLKEKIWTYAHRPPRGYEHLSDRAKPFGVGSWATIGKRSGLAGGHNARRDLRNFKLEETGKLINGICNEIKKEVAQDAITHKEILNYVYNQYH
jgi:tryptophan halogenase|tara:strand:- start:2506 stop:4140 length:1635 start_codon:yes stop_codon:yes gene_type:complete